MWPASRDAAIQTNNTTIAAARHGPLDGPAPLTDQRRMSPSRLMRVGKMNERPRRTRTASWSSTQLSSLDSVKNRFPVKYLAQITCMAIVKCCRGASISIFSDTVYSDNTLVTKFGQCDNLFCKTRHVYVACCLSVNDLHCFVAFISVCYFCYHC